LRIRVSDPDQLLQLSLFLALDPDVQVNVVGDDELEMWFIGSRNAWAQVEETEKRVRRWMTSNPDVVATLIP
jgi:hypothetical protein